MSDNHISLKQVSFAYRDQLVLDNINLEVKKGEYLGIVGPNGSGKTTLIKVILGLLTPKSGKVEIFGQNPTKFQAWSKIGFVPQRVVTSALQFPITASEVVAMGDLNNRGKVAVNRALDVVGMLEHANKILSQLSGGQQQRIFIARALVSDPELLILDEPTTGIDLKSQANFYHLLRDLNQKMKLTLVLISHDIDVIAKEVSKVACLNSKLIFHGTPHEVLNSDFIKELYGKDVRFIAHSH